MRHRNDQDEDLGVRRRSLLEAAGFERAAVQVKMKGCATWSIARSRLCHLSRALPLAVHELGLFKQGIQAILDHGTFSISVNSLTLKQIQVIQHQEFRYLTGILLRLPVRSWISIRLEDRGEQGPSANLLTAIYVEPRQQGLFTKKHLGKQFGGDVPEFVERMR
jgi:hypothetical protein